MRRMRWYYKLLAIVGGLFLAIVLIGAVVGAVVGFVLGLALKVAIAALVVGGIVYAIKRARSHRQVSGKRAEREVRDPEDAGHRRRAGQDEARDGRLSRSA
jgi:membrane protein implicated in regulation of membrane protease activity